MILSKNLRGKISNACAFLISALFSPYLLSIVFFVTISFLYADNLKSFVPALLIGLLFIVVIPVGFSLWQVETKKITDIHLAVHKERKIPFTISAISSLVGALVLYFLHVPTPILAVAFTYAINVIIIAIITWKWKISIHSAFFIASVLILMLFFGEKFWPLFFGWLPLAWARVYRKRHTPLQILGGAIISLLVTIIVFSFFGYKIGG